MTFEINDIHWRKLRRRLTCSKALPFLLIWFMFSLVSGSYSLAAAPCQGEQQLEIFSSLPACQSRPTLLDLRTIFSNHSRVIQVVPDHVTVDRCGGSCFVPAHTCSPRVKSMAMVQVMLIMSKWPHGEHETLCTEVEVEVHHECECGCKVQPDQCLPGLQYYHQPSCRCICSDSPARSSCIQRGAVWDPQTCQCHCPAQSWKHCSTGYMFDYVSTCSCVQISTVASKSVLAAACILFASISVSVVGGSLMFRYKRGPFKAEPPSTKMNQTNNSVKRTIFMSQISRSEFDMMNLKAKLGAEDLLTIYEFDEKRNSLKSQDTIEETI